MIMNTGERMKQMSSTNRLLIQFNTFKSVSVLIICMLTIFLISGCSGEEGHGVLDEVLEESETIIEFDDEVIQQDDIEITAEEDFGKDDILENDWEWIIEPDNEKKIRFVDESKVTIEFDNGEFMMLDLINNNRMKLEWDTVGQYSENYARVSNNEMITYVNANTEQIFNDYFDDGLEVSESVIGVKLDDKWGFINLEGKVIIDFTYEEVTSFDNGIAIVKQNGLWGIINKTGEKLTEFIYQDKKNISEKIIALKVGDKWGFIDNEGKQISEFEYDQVLDFHEDLAAVSQNGKWGYIDTNGNLQIEMIYDGANDFSEGLAAVMLINEQFNRVEWGYIDSNNNIRIDFYPYSASDGRSVYIGPFKDGKAFVTKDLYTIIDVNGTELFSQDSIYFIHGFTYYSKIDGIRGYVFTDENMIVRKYGLVSIDGEERLEPVFDNIREVRGNYVIIENSIDGITEEGLICLNTDKSNP